MDLNGSGAGLEVEQGPFTLSCLLLLIYLPNTVQHDNKSRFTV